MARGNEIDISGQGGNAGEQPDFSSYRLPKTEKTVQLARAEGAPDPEVYQAPEADMQARAAVDQSLSSLASQLRGLSDANAARQAVNSVFGGNKFDKILEKADNGWPNEGGYIQMQKLLAQKLQGSDYSARFEGQGNHKDLVIRYKGQEIWRPRPYPGG